MNNQKRIAIPIKETKLTKCEENNIYIRKLWVHCKFCNFFFLRKFPDDDVCDWHECIEKEEMLKNLF
jgi:hypothetical protein